MRKTDHLPVIFTAQSKGYFYCRDAICEFVLNHNCVPLNPFRVFEYFLGDRVDRDIVRQGNNNLIRISDELWVFGHLIADGVLFEIKYAQNLGKPVRFFTIANRASEITEIEVTGLKFEPEVHAKTKLTKEQLFSQICNYQADHPPKTHNNVQFSFNLEE